MGRPSDRKYEAVKKHRQFEKKGRERGWRTREQGGEKELGETELEEKEDVESERVGDMCYLFPPCKHREKADIINRKLQIVNRRL